MTSHPHPPTQRARLMKEVETPATTAPSTARTTRRSVRISTAAGGENDDFVTPAPGQRTTGRIKVGGEGRETRRGGGS